MNNKIQSFGIFFIIFLTFFSFFVLDPYLTNWMSAFENDFFNFIFSIVTFFGSVYFVTPILILMFFGYFYFKKKNKKISSGLLFISLSIIISWTITKILKVLFARYRPEAYLIDNLYGFSYFSFEFLENSFPSGHTTVAFAMMFSISYIFPKYRWLLMFLAALVGLSRIALGYHFLSDVIFGAFIGLFTTFLIKKKYFGDGFQ